MTDDIRKGDRFEITVEVVEDPTPGDHLVIAASDGIKGSVRKNVLLAGRRLPRPIGVGDRVTSGQRVNSYRVAAVSGKWAFLDQARDEKTGFERPDLVPHVRDLSDLSLVEPSHD